jgi:hypothetical protein
MASIQFGTYTSKQDKEEESIGVCVIEPNPTTSKGTKSYYIFRFEDFIKRHSQCIHIPPQYYCGICKSQMEIQANVNIINNKSYTLIIVQNFLKLYYRALCKLYFYLSSIHIVAEQISTARELWIGLEKELVAQQNSISKTRYGIPDLTTSYGYKYCVAFGTLLRPKLSKEGQSWIDKTLSNLQDYMDKGLVNKSWIPEKHKRFNLKYNLNDKAMRSKFYSNLEINTNKFKEFAFATHPDAYLNAGLNKLPLTDLIRIVITPDFAEWKDLDTVEQAWIVLKSMIEDTAGVEVGKYLDKLDNEVLFVGEKAVNTIDWLIKTSKRWFP